LTTAGIGIRYLERLTHEHALMLTCACAAILFLIIPTQNTGWAPLDSPGEKAREEAEIDAVLQDAASTALGQREGTIIVLDPQTGRVRAIVNPQIAFTQALMPGSTMKPFTALAALRAGLINRDSRTVCPGRFTGLGFSLPCVHDDHLPPFTPSQAIAYSCNYYFASLGQRLGRDRLIETVRSFGFGQTAGAGENEETAGTVRPCHTGTSARLRTQESNHVSEQSDCDAREAVGESDQIQVTPAQLLAAYAALVNGGHLLQVRVADANGFQPVDRASIDISEQHRSIITEGMRGAVRFGTARNAKLDSLPLYIIGKTGTAMPAKGFRSNGWFVGFAGSNTNSVLLGEMKPDEVKLAVIVLLGRSHGSEAATLSRTIFEAYATAISQPDTESQRTKSSDEKTGSNSENGSSSPRLPSSAPVRVHLVHDGITQEMSLEDYVLGVLRTEGSMEPEPEALKALAIAIRTYAVRNRGRHAKDGYDFCSTTHCQRFAVDRGTGPTVKAGLMTNGALAYARASDTLIAAVKATEGQLLLDDHGQPAEVYFGASCGGETANLGTLWGVSPPEYLRGVRDEYCLSGPHATWTDVIARADLLRALQSDVRTDVGARLDQVTVNKRDETGRAEFIALEGERRKIVRGWDFKIIVGRVLGWNILKSSRFDIARTGSNFVFRGSGFGHGLGLCQEGAHVMAARGGTYQRILEKYFPGTSLGKRDQVAVNWSGKGSWNSNAEGAKVLAESTEEDFCVPLRSPLRPLRLNYSYDYQPSVGWKADLLLTDSPLPLGKGRGEGLATNPTHFEFFSYPSGSEKRKESSFRCRWLATPLTPALSQRAREQKIYKHFVLTGLNTNPRILTISSEHFRVTYPAGVDRRDANEVLNTLEAARSDFLHRASAASVSANIPLLEIRLNESTGDFTSRTGQPWWAAAATKGHRIELQPVGLLKRRGVLTTTLRHEFAHVVIDEVSRNRAPRWLEEGFALYLAGEGQRISRYLSRNAHSTEELERRLARPGTQDEMRALYAEAYQKVMELIRQKGEAGVWASL
jgi:SpoIID/LytB domain protein